MTKKKKIIIIISVVLAVLIAAGTAFAIWWFSDDTPTRRRKKKKVVVIKQYPTSDTASTDDNSNSSELYFDDVTSDVTSDVISDDIIPDDTSSLPSDENQNSNDTVTTPDWNDNNDFDNEDDTTTDNNNSSDLENNSQNDYVSSLPNESGSENDNTNQDNSDDTNSDDDFIFEDKRDLYEEEENYIKEYIPEYEVTAVDWKGPEGYVIVIPEGDKNSKIFAKTIQQYFGKNTKVKLEIVTDKQNEQTKEILIGDTNRYKSKLKENEYAVQLSNNKLIFEGGHYAMTCKAVNWFVDEKYESGKVNTLSGKTEDFTANKDGGYVYVWGDEFSGSSIDNGKWLFSNRMAGSALLETRTDKEVASVGEDNLKLRAIRSYRKQNPIAQYATMQSLNTMKTMSFREGYLEMSARVPFISGAWPSLWANSNGALNNTVTKPYTIEIDIFEVFSSVDTLIPNIHKWRGIDTPSQYNTDHFVDGVKVPATNYVFENTDNLINEYHIYGFKWTETEMTMSVDGEDYMTFDLTEDFDNKDGMDGFKVPVSLLINNHMFAPDIELMSGASNVNNLDLPYEYDIDWIRLYQIPGKGELNLAE